jgi:hypothetical protein
MNEFEIVYKDRSGQVIKTDKVVRVKRNKLKDIISLQQDILFSFLQHNASIGSVIADNAVWSNIEKLSKLLPVIGEEKPGIDLSLIEDDIPQLLKIFITQSVSEDGNLISGEEEVYKPSYISQLHQLDYYGSIRDAAKKLHKMRSEEEM